MPPAFCWLPSAYRRQPLRREWMGVEPTDACCSQPPTDFEDQGRHRATSTPTENWLTEFLAGPLPVTFAGSTAPILQEMPRITIFTGPSKTLRLVSLNAELQKVIPAHIYASLCLVETGPPLFFKGGQPLQPIGVAGAANQPAPFPLNLGFVGGFKRTVNQLF